MVDSVTRVEEIEERDEVPSIAIINIYNVGMTVKRAEGMDKRGKMVQVESQPRLLNLY